ncbi:BZ3500_MvSof-1268-A1-R1_Chr3-1g05465 [Microbotryum saponariae]|uniref:BZ3500_MvSof-1268-A1-R1_Chr3-1g05465 protein n=1 Tax=Microbotryum saponariae TaxID=289078 RepID=A0A2X0KWS4_9BASI|nr:BZ3500_MvSof-1268-A1-R1_Chr3-1g05465 [Microbotryum saponariae]SDA04656.1 BZ3501_MvSof-1269-A2-R1_Chr3-1g05136 [Microbotryum saponariae]
MDSDECDHKLINRLVPQWLPTPQATVHPTSTTTTAAHAPATTTALKSPPFINLNSTSSTLSAPTCTSPASTKTLALAMTKPEPIASADVEAKSPPPHHHLHPSTYQLDPVKWQHDTQRMLNKTLGPEFISTRAGPSGSKLTYIEGWKLINLANEVFGFNGQSPNDSDSACEEFDGAQTHPSDPTTGWYSSVKELTIDYIDFIEKTERYNVSASAIVNVRMPDGAYHEDVGCGSAENQKTKSAALDKAKKEAVTDGLKRALRSFGKLMGNCVYDKHYVVEAEKMTKTKPKVDFKNIFRPAYDAEMEEKARKKSLENDNENAPAQDIKKITKGGPSAAPAPMRAPALPARATTTLSATRVPPAAPSRAPLAPMQTNQTPKPTSLQPTKPMVKGECPASDPFSADDTLALQGMDLDASTYLGTGTNFAHEGDSGFSEGGLFDAAAEVKLGNNGGPQAAHTSNGPDHGARRLNEKEEAGKKRMRTEEMEMKRQAALLRQQQKSMNQQQQHRSPPNAGSAGLQRSKTVGNPSTNTARPITVQAGTLPTINVGAGGTKLSPGSSGKGAPVSGPTTFVSARTMKRTLIDEPYETVITRGVNGRPDPIDPSKRPRPA